MNLMSVDILKILNLITFINEFWSAPLKIGACIYFLWQILGPSVLAGVGVMVCLIPCNAILGKWSRRVQLQEMKNKDQRVKLMGELLAGIKVIGTNLMSGFVTLNTNFYCFWTGFKIIRMGTTLCKEGDGCSSKGAGFVKESSLS